MPKAPPESLVSRLLGLRRERDRHVAETAAEARDRLQDLAIVEAAGTADPDDAAELAELLDALGESPETFAEMVAAVREIVAAGAAAQRAEGFLSEYSARLDQAVEAMRDANDRRNAATRAVHTLKSAAAAARRDLAAWGAARRQSPGLADDARLAVLIERAAEAG